MTINNFNIRVYGILIDNNSVLVADELILGKLVTKFPGGGLSYGEGTIDCLKREFMEETNNIIEVVDHFYTTDYFQPSAFKKQDQIISIYYLVKSPEAISTVQVEENLSLRWIAMKDISEDDFTLPIDKIIGKKLREL